MSSSTTYPQNRPDFRNSTAKLKNKSRSLNKFITKYLGHIDYNERLPGVTQRIYNLIKLVKYWYQEFVSSDYGHDHDLALNKIEEATLEVWRKVDSPKTINMAIAFKAVMEELRHRDPYAGSSSTCTHLSLFEQAVMETLRKPFFIDVSVTRNWCRTPVKTLSTVSRPSGVYKDFRDIPASEQSTINTFIADKLQPDESFSKPILDALDKLCRYLEGTLPDVNRIRKSGSMGKGTALKGKSDLDCVMMLTDIQDVEVLKRRVGPLKEKLIKILQSGDTVSFMSGWEINVKNPTPFCVKFSMKSRRSLHTIVDVDLLPTFDKNSFELDKLYEQMRTKDEETRRYYSAALTELQLEFVKPIPGRVKDLIRLVKYWCKEFVVPVGRSRGVYPNSYLLELVTINAWEEVGEPLAFNIAVGFRAVMEKLRLHKYLDIVWYDNYGPSQVLDKRVPRIVDPANPFNNVYDIVTEWPTVVAVVNETLKKPFVKGTRVTHEWK